jgi:ABC-type nitrate/sulfonate/bicarbonate transport system substrate-binding protein
LLILCLVAAACAPAQSAPSAVALIPVKICYAAHASTEIVVWYTFENGLYQKYGLQPQLLSITGGAQSVTAMVAKQVDVCGIAGGPVANGVAAGEDPVMIAGLYDKFLFALAVGPGIQKPEDLIGKAIGVGSARGTKDTAARLGLAHLGLQPDTQVALTAFTNNDENVMAAAVASGQVAGAILSLPLPAKFRAQGLHTLLDLSTLDVSYQGLGLATTRSYLLAHRDVALNVVKATIDAIARMKADPDGTKAVLAKYQALDLTAEAATLTEAYQEFVQQNLPALPYPSTAGMQSVLTEAVAANPSAAKVTLDQLIDASLVRELDNGGFMASLSK